MQHEEWYQIATDSFQSESGCQARSALELLKAVESASGALN
jgi:hypothetical protein